MNVALEILFSSLGTVIAKKKSDGYALQFETELKKIKDTVVETKGEKKIKKVNKFLNDKKCRNGRNFEKNGEKFCLNTMEELFDCKFRKSRPKWLLNPETGKALELDGYNKELEIAFEYNGIQHYSFEATPFFKTREQYNKQIERDKFKQRMCRKKGIILLIIPYNINRGKLKEYLITEFLKEKKKLGRE